MADAGYCARCGHSATSHVREVAECRAVAPGSASSLLSPCECDEYRPTETLPRLGERAPDQGARRCLYLDVHGRACGRDAVEHLLYRDGDVARTSTACHLHVPMARQAPGYADHHVWSTWQDHSACDRPFATWRYGTQPGLGWCEELRDDQDAELAELLQHATVTDKPTDP